MVSIRRNPSSVHVRSFARPPGAIANASKQNNTQTRANAPQDCRKRRSANPTVSLLYATPARTCSSSYRIHVLIFDVVTVVIAAV